MNHKKAIVIVLFLSSAFMLSGYEINPSWTKGTPLDNDQSTEIEYAPADYFPATKQNELLFVEDPGDTGFGPLVKPDTNWHSVLNNILGPGNYGWFGATTAQNQDGPDLATMQTYPIVIWNCYDNWWYFPAPVLTSNDTANISDYINSGGKVWLIGQDIMYSGVPQSWVSTNFHMSSYIEDYLISDSSVLLQGLAEIQGYSLTVNNDYQHNGFRSDNLATDTSAHAIIIDSMYSGCTAIASPNTTPLQTSLWTIDGRDPNSPSDWLSIVREMLEAFGWDQISERTGGIRPAIIDFEITAPTHTRGRTMVTLRALKQTDINLSVYSCTGKLVANLIDGSVKAGTTTIYWDGSDAAGGIYFLWIKAGEYITTHKLVLVK